MRKWLLKDILDKNLALWGYKMSPMKCLMLRLTILSTFFLVHDQIIASEEVAVTTNAVPLRRNLHIEHQLMLPEDTGRHVGFASDVVGGTKRRSLLRSSEETWRRLEKFTWSLGRTDQAYKQYTEDKQRFRDIMEQKRQMSVKKNRKALRGISSYTDEEQWESVRERTPVEMMLNRMFDIQHGYIVVTPDDVNSLRAMSPESLEQKLQKVLQIPQPKNLNILQMLDAMPDYEVVFRIQNTTTLVDVFADTLLDGFFHVECNSQETKDDYVKWLQNVLVPSIVSLIEKNKQKALDVFTQSQKDVHSIYKAHASPFKRRIDIADQEMSHAKKQASLEMVVPAIMMPLVYTSDMNAGIKLFSYGLFAGLSIYELVTLLEKIKQQEPAKRDALQQLTSLGCQNQYLKQIHLQSKVGKIFDQDMSDFKQSLQDKITSFSERIQAEVCRPKGILKQQQQPNNVPTPLPANTVAQTPPPANASPTISAHTAVPTPGIGAFNSILRGMSRLFEW